MEALRSKMMQLYASHFQLSTLFKVDKSLLIIHEMLSLQ